MDNTRNPQHNPTGEEVQTGNELNMFWPERKTRGASKQSESTLGGNKETQDGQKCVTQKKMEEGGVTISL